ncbi:MAG: GTPase Era [Bacillota bacterium]
MTFKSGFVTIIGRPNVGKSTLINKLIGEKTTIVSKKPQTTRNQLKAIYTDENGQVVFMDTPGIHKAKNELDKYMLDQAFQSLKGIDLVLFMVDATSPFGRGDNFILKQIKNLEIPVIVLMNKIDKINNKVLFKRQNNYEQKTNLEVIPISAKKTKNIDSVKEKIFSLLDEGPKYYPEDMFTDQIEKFIVAEFIREEIFKFTREEIPYGVAVLVEEMKERDNNMIFVRANVIVEKKSHKGIIIGKNGKMLKKIGSNARKSIEKLLNTKVYLDLWVKVKKDWREDKNLLRQMGYKE